MCSGATHKYGHGAAQRSRSTLLDSHSDNRDEDAWGDRWVLNVYSCPNVESKHGHASAPSACPPRAAPRPVATGAQRPYATARPSAPPCACTLAAVASPPDAPPIVVVASPPSARAAAVSRG